MHAVPSMNESLNLRPSFPSSFLPCPFHLKKHTSLFPTSSRMEFTTELSLASSSSSRKFIDSETSSESGTNNGVNPKKRKTPSSYKHSSIDSNSITTDLHRVMMDNNNRRPLPLDWEQCLDLHSGMMYYMNRKTSRKSWNLPSYKDDADNIDNNLNLELNISNNYSSSNSSRVNKKVAVQSQRKEDGEKGCNNMVALACSNCHLLVILSKSSPSCPNCKYIHALNSHLSNNNDDGYNVGNGVDQRHAPHKSINNTLSLLN